MITTYNNPYRMGGYEGCGPDWTGKKRCPCLAVGAPRASGPTVGFSGVIDELGPVPKLAVGLAMLAGAFVILKALDGAKS